MSTGTTIAILLWFAFNAAVAFWLTFRKPPRLRRAAPPAAILDFRPRRSGLEGRRSA